MIMTKCTLVFILLSLILNNAEEIAVVSNNSTNPSNETTSSNDTSVKATEEASTLTPTTLVSSEATPEPSVTTNNVTVPTTPSSTVTANVTSGTTLPSLPTEAPHRSRQFDGPSFIGGIVLTTGLMAIGQLSIKQLTEATCTEGIQLQKSLLVGMSINSDNPIQKTPACNQSWPTNR
ncbi:hypothetical protein FQA39_LY06259 [Lamprigera yunnana]|nr:hypothetical protein FQA39_LY06259 [Lamprigera yunnana]